MKKLTKKEIAKAIDVEKVGWAEFKYSGYLEYCGKAVHVDGNSHEVYILIDEFATEPVVVRMWEPDKSSIVEKVQELLLESN